MTRFMLKIVKHCTKAQLIPIIQGKILAGSTINTDGWKAYYEAYYGVVLLNGYTLESSTATTNLLEENVILMVLNHFEVFVNEGWLNLAG